jgi:hypothetical protein
MTIKTAIVKKANPKQVVVVHSCTQEETIRKINLILLGNGKPEDGLAFIVKNMSRINEDMCKDLSEIKCKFSLSAEVNNELETQNRVRDAIIKEREKIKNELIKQKELDTSQKTFSWSKIGIGITALSLVVLLVFQILNYSLNKKIKTEINSVETETKK